jgi:hypothetical protein
VAQPPDSSARRGALLDVDVSLAVDTPVLRSRPDAEADVGVSVGGEEGLLGVDLGLGLGMIVAVLPPARRRKPYEAD